MLAPLRIGVLLAFPAVQFLDVSPVDLFGMLTPQYLSLLPEVFPANFSSFAVPIEIEYISVSSFPSLSPPLHYLVNTPLAIWPLHRLNLNRHRGAKHHSRA
jgi:hypothetical protein